MAHLTCRECPRCGGSGEEWMPYISGTPGLSRIGQFYRCPDCGGEGVVVDELATDDDDATISQCYQILGNWLEEGVFTCDYWFGTVALMLRVGRPLCGQGTLTKQAARHITKQWMCAKNCGRTDELVSKQKRGL